MKVQELRHELELARQLLQEDRPADALLRIEHSLATLDEQLLTTTEAKNLLGLGSVNTVKLLVRKAGIRTEQHGNRMMIPLSELHRLQNTTLMRGLHASDRLHQQSADLGTEDGLAREDYEMLVDEQPGAAPWTDDLSHVPA